MGVSRLTFRASDKRCEIGKRPRDERHIDCAVANDPPDLKLHTYNESIYWLAHPTGWQGDRVRQWS